MCEIFAVSASKTLHLNPYLDEFFLHSIEHPNGWGIAMLDGHNVSIEKEPVMAMRSRYLKERMRAAIYAKTCIAHIRYATIGKEDYNNCHPFTGVDNSGRRWTLAHNGTIFNYPPLESYSSKQVGETDSERILLYLLDCVNGFQNAVGHALGPQERLSLVDSYIVNLAPDNKLNLVIYDGELLYVHTNYPSSLFCLNKDGALFFATEPLSKENWEQLPMTQLLVYREGECVYQGTEHRQVYVEDAENVRLLYLAYSGL